MESGMEEELEWVVGGEESMENEWRMKGGCIEFFDVCEEN